MDEKKIRVKPFNTAWWIIFICQFLLVFLLKFIFRNSSYTETYKFMTEFSIFNLIYLVVYKFTLSKTKGFDFNFWNELPFYLCNVGSIFAYLALKFNDKTMMAFCYCVGTVGALMGYFMPSKKFINAPLFSSKIIGFYGYHGLLIVINLSFRALGIYQPSVNDLMGVIYLCIIVVLVAHIVNMILRHTIYPEANYIFNYEPTNVVLAKVYKICPVKCIYLYLLLPVVAILFLIMCI